MAKIMLVEDDRSLQEIYSIRLVAEGYDIAKADDGEEALAKAVQEKPDLIIADVMMPKISGFDMLDILRSQPETQNIKVIMMTALSSDDQRKRGEALGAERYLVKSQVGIEDVINTVHEVLGDKPNNNAKANIETLSNIPATPAPQPVPNTDTLAAVPTTPTTTIQPTNPAAGPAPIPQQIPPNPTGVTPSAPNGADPSVSNGETPQNFNQAPVAMPGTVPNAQAATNPTAGATLAPATQSADSAPIAAPPIPQPALNIQPPSIPLPVPPVPVVAPGAPTIPMPIPAPQGNTIQTADRIQPNAQLSAAIQAAEAYARASSAGKKTEEKQNGGERVIQPIHDPRRDDLRQQMEKQMEEILGDDANVGEPQAITTKTARKVTVAPTPAPETPQAPTEVTEATSEMQTQKEGLPLEAKQDPAEQASNVNLAPDTNGQQDSKLTKLATPTNADGPEQTVAIEPKQVTAEPSEPTDASTAPAELEEEKIEPIRPGYIAQLEDDLSEDVEKDLAMRMADELKDDDITKKAQALAATNAATTNESDEAIKQATANALVSPNISSGPGIEPTKPETQVSIKAQQPDSTPVPTEINDNIPH